MYRLGLSLWVRKDTFESMIVVKFFW